MNKRIINKTIVNEEKVSKILFVGDIHGSVGQLKKIVRLASQKLSLDLDSESLMVIQVGDFGYHSVLVDQMDFDFNFRFIDGNHEMFSLLVNDNPKSWIKRGTILSFASGVKLGACGGAWSIDHEYQKRRGTWFPEEMMTIEEAEEIANFWNENKVDFVVGHDTPERMYRDVIRNPITNIVPNRHALGLDLILEKVKPELWIHGHHHINKIYEKMWSPERVTTFRCLDFVDRVGFVDKTRLYACCTLVDTEKNLFEQAEIKL